ncbi:unnamed protein product [Sympodiomycopsis kandeliae]
MAPSPPRYEDDAAESEALILHRLDTDPQGRPRVSTIPSSPYQDEVQEGDSDLENQTDESLEKRRIRALASRAASSPSNSGGVGIPGAVDTKNGRPPWLVHGVSYLKKMGLVRQLLLAAAALSALFGVFYIALGPLGGSISDSVRAWKWKGNTWTDGNIPFTFPDDVGYPGPTEPGSPSDLADEDKVIDSRPMPPNFPVETRLPESLYGSFDPFLHMGPLTPYRSSDGWGVDDTQYHIVPETCQIEQVHYLSRHGSRYPTSGSPANKIKDFLAQQPKPQFTGPLAFLNNYQYRLGKEILVPLGRQQLYDEGIQAVIKYGRLIYADIAEFGNIFARAGSQHRIVESGRNWLAGALGVGNDHKQSALEIQIEAPHFNTTMAPNFACPNAGKGEYEPGLKWFSEWVKTYTRDAVKRLQPHVQGAELTPELVNALQQLCSYDTVAGFDATAMCSLFTKQEWLDYEYAWDLEFYGGYGFGSPIGPAQGIGWVNEFLSRLQGIKWDPSTQTSENSTLASDDTTFPLNRRFYVDFTHDSVIVNVLSALNLLNFKQDLPVTRPDPNRVFKTSQVVPFSSRLVIEKLSCGQHKQRWVRMNLNDRIIPLNQLPECEQERKDGLCSLEKFVQSQSQRMQRVHWDRCFA